MNCQLSDETRRGTSKRNVHDDALHCMSDECILSLAKKDLANLFKLKVRLVFSLQICCWESLVMLLGRPF